MEFNKATTEYWRSHLGYHEYHTSFVNVTVGAVMLHKDLYKEWNDIRKMVNKNSDINKYKYRLNKGARNGKLRWDICEE